MVMPNNERVGRGLDAVRDGLLPVCEAAWKAAYGEDWLNVVNSRDSHPSGTPDPSDLAFLLKGMQNTWQEVWRHQLGQGERAFTSELRDARNKWAHQNQFSTDDAYPIHHWGDLPGSGVNPFSLHNLRYDRDHSRGSNPVRRSDALIVAPDGTECRVPACLLDTGASSCSYMSPAFAEAHRAHLHILPLRQHASVRLGDGKTIHQITHYVLAACLFNVRGKFYSGSIVFYLFESGFDIIIVSLISSPTSRHS